MPVWNVPTIPFIQDHPWLRVCPPPLGAPSVYAVYYKIIPAVREDRSMAGEGFQKPCGRFCNYNKSMEVHFIGLGARHPAGNVGR